MSIRINYKSIADLNSAIVNNLWQVSPDIDLLVGVPRSGLLAANIMALHLNLPLTDLEGLLEKRLIKSGKRLSATPFDEFKNILIIEDSVWSGSSIEETKQRIAGKLDDKNVSMMAVFMAPGKDDIVDFYMEMVPGPRIFEWNMMHHPMLEKCCVDIDGVLCVDPTKEENDNGPRYEEFLTNAKLLSKPSKTIGYLVTNRLEKYRPHTEAWLAKHHIKYNELIMEDSAGPAERSKKMPGEFKSKAYIQFKPTGLFIESDRFQAEEIANRSGKPVYCYDTRELIYPNPLAGKYRQIALKTERLFSRVSAKLKRSLGIAG